MEMTQTGNPGIVVDQYTFRICNKLVDGSITGRCLVDKCPDMLKTNAGMTEIPDSKLEHQGKLPATMRPLPSAH